MYRKSDWGAIKINKSNFMAQQERQDSAHLPVSAVLILGLLCFLWGAQSVSIKFSNVGVPPLMAATFRSLVAATLVWGYARIKGRSVAYPSGQSFHAMMIGLLFGLEFFFLYWSLVFTPVSRSLIFIYTHPFWVALGAHFFLKGDRLAASKFFGLVLAFCGVAAVFQVRSPALPPLHWIGDFMALSAALFWAATTLYVKNFAEKIDLDHFQTLFAQLIYSVPVLALGAVVFELPAQLDFTPLVLGSLFYQSVVVAFISYLIWFWLINRYMVSRLAAFTFMAPLFGVILGGSILNEPVTMLVWFGLTCVAVGVYIVNR
jgi:drug/metabolite transporter (DMT)-like permease